MNNFDFTALEKRLRYDRESGDFFWLVRVNSKVPAGAKAGNRMNTGYWHITIKGKKFLAHRLAWVFVYGKWPSGQIDHINGVRTDNRIANLRDVTSSENLQNRKRAGKNNPYIGVSSVKGTTKWQAHIGFGGKQKNLGHFDTPEAARKAYLDAKKIYHPTAPVN
jgi:hypothetical protein